MIYLTRTILLALAASMLAAGSAAQAADARAVRITNFDTPVYVTGAPGEANLLFVVEQPGRVRVLDNEVTVARPFLNIASLVTFGGEQGLLSIAFPPNYQTSRLFYVAFTNRNGDVEVDEFRRSATNHKIANPNSRRRVIVIRHRDAGNHNGGQLEFGRDGFLYISIGDGGATPQAAPNLHLLLGKILRIDPRRNGTDAYSIPNDNPFVGSGNREEIWSYGLRNPWRFAFEGNRIIIADVGESEFEEINYLNVSAAKGANFGWPQFEGRHDTGNGPAGADPVTFPMLVYSHNRGGCAVIGGYVSHDRRIPALSGRYIYGDLCDGRILSMVPDVAAQKATDRRAVGITAPNLSSFGRGPRNRLYFTQTSGELKRIAPLAP
jgi:glucose/arabinose dehydrogenase